METGKILYQAKELSEEQKEKSFELQEKGIHPVMSDLYVLRGINNFNDINLIQRLEPFSNMKGTKEAAEILAQAIINKESICIVADYDVDGATACAIGVRGLRMFGANIDFVVPDRFIHGYGLQPSVVDEAINKKNPDLIVTVDNGILSHAGVDYAHEKGVKVLVTDHHLAGNTLPNADCIVNPNQPDCNFTSKCIAGCGVMFYVLAALRQHMIELKIYTLQNAPNISLLLDLVAVGTVADLVKLDKNNRIMVKLGLDLIRKGKAKAGILALCEVAKKPYEKLGTMDIGFGIAPRINAAGRLEDMSIGINCLLTDDENIALKFAKNLDEINKNRKLLESEMKTVALDLDSLKTTGNSKVAYDATFHEGVIGIVASRLKELFYRPSIVFANAQEDGLLKGSGRSIPEIHLRDVLDYVYKKDSSIMVKFGGHAMAAGLTIHSDRYEDFSVLFEEAVTYFAENKELKNLKEIDLTLSSDYINLETADIIRAEVWGQGFPHPLFKGKFFILEQKILKNTHLKLILEKDHQRFEGIWFSRNSIIEQDEVEFIYTLSINEFMGNRTVQFLIENIYNF
jgi:single-stranded-DNA-specific exonuclease